MAAVGLLGASAARADYLNGDLLVGVYQPGVNSTTVVDLGSFASISGQTFEQWDLSSALAAAGFGSTLANTAIFGVVGESATGTTPNHAIYLTAASPTVPNEISGAGAFNQIKADIINIGDNLGTQLIPNPNLNANSPDWYSQTINYVANGGGVGNSAGINVNASLGAADLLYKTTANNTSPVAYDSFTLSPAGLLTYGSVPEPSAFALLTGGGLLAFSLRNRFRAKSAKLAS